MGLIATSVMTVSLFTVFGAAFLAATILPFYSEVVLAAALADPETSRWLLWTAATTGNTLGAAVNWVLGRVATHYRDHKWFPATEAQMNKAEGWFQKYGVWSLLMSWMPVGGDALTVIAGLLRVRFDVFLILVAIGKGTRYAVVIAGVEAFIW